MSTYRVFMCQRKTYICTCVQHINESTYIYAFYQKERPCRPQSISRKGNLVKNTHFHPSVVLLQTHTHTRMQDTETHSTHTNAHIHSQIPTHTHTHARISPLAFPHSHLENKETCRANLQPQKKNTLGKDTKEIGKTRRNRAKDQVIESKDMAQQERGRREWRLF